MSTKREESGKKSFTVWMDPAQVLLVKTVALWTGTTVEAFVTEAVVKAAQEAWAKIKDNSPLAHFSVDEKAKKKSPTH